MADIQTTSILGDMSVSAVLIFGLLLLVSYSLVWAIYCLLFSPLSAIPGPKLWAISHIPYLSALRGGHLHRQVHKLHLKYGPVVRLSPDDLSFVDAEAWAAIYAYKAGGCYAKSPRWYRPRVNGAYGLISSLPVDHGRFRRTFAPAFKEKSLQDQESLILRHTRVLIDKLRIETKQCDSVNVTDWLEYAAFDIAGDFAFSEPFRCLEEPENRVQIRIVQSWLKVFALSIIARTSALFSLWISVSSSWRKTDKVRFTYAKTLTSWARRRLEEGETPGKDDLMAWVARRTGDGKELSAAEAENSLSDFLIAGTETVASTVTAILYYLSQKPEIKSKVTQEVRKSFNNVFEIDMNRTETLEYLNAIIKEAMRLCPTLPNTMPRIVPQSGAMISGKWIPGGTFVTFSQYAAYHSPLNFSRAGDFIPERWLAESMPKIHNADVYQPFSVGPRNCIGKAFGLAEIRLLLANILWEFDVESMDGNWAWEDQNAWFVWDKKAVCLKLKPADRH